MRLPPDGVSVLTVHCLQSWLPGGGLVHVQATVDPTAVVEAAAVVQEGAKIGKVFGSLEFLDGLHDNAAGLRDTISDIYVAEFNYFTINLDGNRVLLQPILPLG